MSKKPTTPFELPPVVPTKNTKIKHLFYNWDQEMEVIRMKCKSVNVIGTTQRSTARNYRLSIWHCSNSPSKQFEAYYDVYWTADRKVIKEISKYTWGHTHFRTPPATWRNTQANANLYILFVAKEPETQLNCKSDGTLKSNQSLLHVGRMHMSA